MRYLQIDYSLAILLLVVAGLTPQPSPASRPTAEIPVNSLADTISTDGRCTLREALLAAKTNTAVDTCPAGSPNAQDTITFTVKGTILLNSPLLISRGVTIQGRGPEATILDGQGSTRVLQLDPAGSGPVALNDLTIRNGRAPSGGGFYALNAPCDSSFSITNSLFQGSSAADDGGAILAGCGSWSVTASTFSANTAENGGGITIFTAPPGSGNTLLTIKNSTFSANKEGAVFVRRWDNAESTVALQVQNSTILGSGRYNIELAAESPSSHITAQIEDTLIANWSGPNCFLTNAIGVPLPEVISQGYNLANTNECGFNETADHLAATSLLAGTIGPLQNNGGPTATHALLPGSPAIDAGSCSGGAVLADQRGIPRPQGPACDIGAYESLLNNTTFLPQVRGA